MCTSSSFPFLMPPFRMNIITCPVFGGHLNEKTEKILAAASGSRKREGKTIYDEGF